MLHIGDPSRPYKGHQFKYGDIMYNTADPLMITEGKYVGPSGWPGQIAQLKGGSSQVTQLYATLGGDGSSVIDFQTIKTIYNNNHQSFSGTDLEKNFRVFRKTFPAVDGIDMDCEETYDVPSFVAFCKMLIGFGFGITFCPYIMMDFWTGALVQIEKDHPRAVKWWNLQCYDGGGNNDPQTWANAIKNAFPGRQTNGYIVAGDWARFYDPNSNSWGGDCPPSLQAKFSGFSSEPCIGGGFVWSLDAIRSTMNAQPAWGSNGCGSADISLAGYVAAIRKGLGV
jgi:hypothetical protein